MKMVVTSPEIALNENNGTSTAQILSTDIIAIYHTYVPEMYQTMLTDVKTGTLLWWSYFQFQWSFL